jgi:hypothetical protein
MKPESLLVAFVIAFLIREVLYFYSTQKLINKIMSKSYHDYNFAKNVAQTLKPQPTLAQDLHADEQLAEDLGPLREFTGLN